MLNELEIRPPLDVEELCRRFAERQGKPIHLVAYDIPAPGPFGVWIGTDEADFIVYQRQTSRAHQRHIILHEFGHKFAGHRSGAPPGLIRAVGRGGQAAAQPGEFSLPPETAVRCALGRSLYDTEQEREAETVATIILEWASVLDHVVPGHADDGVAQRMGAALSDRLGWL
ncbi:hypothetical protein [Streptomyces sp. NBC_00079]|uniref:hypothetical protein n=1 Tax=Streptomyces sp. NBC_00079 TaxID=2975644 RepID=UPI003249FB59